MRDRARHERQTRRQSRRTLQARAARQLQIGEIEQHVVARRASACRSR